MRLFIAVDLPKELIKYLFFLQTYFSELNLVNSFHLTLKFLGETKPHFILDKLNSIKEKPFELELDELGVFPDKINPKVIWMGIKEQPVLFSLQHKIDSALKDYNNNVKFHPHITLARCSDKIMFPKLKIEPMKFTVNEFKLYQSILTIEGPAYEEIKTFNLS